MHCGLASVCWQGWDGILNLGGLFSVNRVCACTAALLILTVICVNHPQLPPCVAVHNSVSRAPARAEAWLGDMEHEDVAGLVGEASMDVVAAAAVRSRPRNLAPEPSTDPFVPTTRH